VCVRACARVCVRAVCARGVCVLALVRVRVVYACSRDGKVRRVQIHELQIFVTNQTTKAVMPA